MQLRTAKVLCLVLALSVYFLTESFANAAEWRAGVSKAKITPQKLMPMAGYASRGTKHAEGTLTDLWAKTLVLQDQDGKQAALITFDLVGIDAALSDSICDALQKQHNWDRSQIAFCFSHTHTGPVVAGNLRPMHRQMFDEVNVQLVDEYAAFLKTSVIKSVQEAVQNLKPAQIEMGQGQATFAVNRRNNPEGEVPALREAGELKGPVDHDVPVLKVIQDGKPAAIVFGYACHNTVLGIMQWSGDYSGFAQIELEKEFPGCQAMFFTGCGGDQNPLPRRTVELAEKYGRQLADAVVAVAKGKMQAISPTLVTKYEEVPIRFGPLPTQDQLAADTKSSNVYQAARAKMLLEQVESGSPLSQTYDYPVQVWKLGTQLEFVLLSGEVVVDYSIHLKGEKQSDVFPPAIWVAGYANDIMAYIPSKRVLLEGRYEGDTSMVYYGLPTVWAPEIEETILTTVRKLSAQKSHQ